MDLTHVMTILGWLLAPVCSAMVVALVGERRALKEARAAAAQEESEREAMMRKTFKAILRTELVNAYEKYVQDGVPLTVERKHEITEGYEAYAYWGGNGTGKDMYEAICEVPVVIVK